MSARTVARLESGQVATQLSGFLRVFRALGLLDRFEALIPPVGPGPVAQLQLQGKSRQRASRRKTATPPKAKWTWGDET